MSESNTVTASPEGLKRRTVLAGAAWAIPVISLAVATPAAAASAALALTFTAVPDFTRACGATTQNLTVTLTGVSIASIPVQLSLPTGFSFKTGVTGIYLTNANGVATIPAGDIIVGASSGTLVASAVGAQTSVVLPVASAGVLQYGTGNATVPDVADFVREYGSGAGGSVAIKSNGDIWRWIPSTATWIAVGVGASTEPNQAGLSGQVGSASVLSAVWIKGGVLQYGSGAGSVPNNSGFVRVYGGDAHGLLAVKSSGDLWRYSTTSGWSLVGTGAGTDPSQVAFSNVGGVVSPVWIKNGVLQYNSTAATMTPNSGFARVYGGTTIGVLAVKTNGDLWRYNPSSGWALIGSGADTGANAGGFSSVSGAFTAVWIKAGVVQFGGAAAVWPGNSGVVRIYQGDTQGVAAITSAGVIWRYTPATSSWTQIGTGASTEPSAAGFCAQGDATINVHWIKNYTEC